MKRIIVFYLLLLPFTSISQITEVAKNESTKIGKVPGIIECTKRDNTYIFIYTNIKYSSIVDYKSFAVSEEDFETLFTKLNEAFKLPDKGVMNLDLPRNKLIINKKKYIGVPCIDITNFEKESSVMSFTGAITKKQLAKLFGK